MNMHPTPAERLLSMLEEDGTVEALPAGEVRGDLAAFGVDPARAIAFARSLARGGDSPGGRLMGALLAGEAEDEEVARIEAADIEEVRAKIPHGAAAAIAAEARRKAGIDGNVVGLAERRRKRRRLIVWGGPLAGIAASLLVVVFFMGNAYLSRQSVQIAEGIRASRVEAPEPEMPDPALEGYTKPGPDKSLADEMQALGVPPELEAGQAAKEKDVADGAPAAPDEEMLAFNESRAPPAAEKKSVAPAESEDRLRKREEFAAAPLPSPQASPESDGTAGAEADIAADDGRAGIAPRPTESPDLPVIVAPRESEPAEETAGTEMAVAPPAAPDVSAGLLRNVEISEIAAVLVVDPARASLQIQSQILPAGGLEQRLAEARRLAGDRPVIALYTIATGPARRDFAQVPLQTGLTQQMAAPSPLVGLLGVEASEYDFIALPAE